MDVLPAMAGAFGVLVFVVMVPVLLYFRPHGEPKPTEQASADKAQVGKEASGGKFHVGDQVQIARPGGAGNFHVARTEADLDRLHEAIDRKELATFREMREAGDIDVVPNGMKATVLESKEGRVKVRLTRPASGDEAVGWIDDQNAQPIMAEPDQPAPVIAAPAQAIDPSAPAPAPKPVAADSSKRKPRYAGEVLPGESLYDKMQQEHPDPPK